MPCCLKVAVLVPEQCAAPANPACFSCCPLQLPLWWLSPPGKAYSKILSRCSMLSLRSVRPHRGPVSLAVSWVSRGPFPGESVNRTHLRHQWSCW